MIMKPLWTAILALTIALIVGGGIIAFVIRATAPDPLQVTFTAAPADAQ
jgi:hypothetical protein